MGGEGGSIIIHTVLFRDFLERTLKQGLSIIGHCHKKYQSFLFVLIELYTASKAGLEKTGCKTALSVSEAVFLPFLLLLFFL